MTDRHLPQRWNESAPSFAEQEAPGGAGHDQESVLKVLIDCGGLVRRHWRVVLATTLASLALLFLQLRYDHPIYRALAVVRYEDKGRALSNGLSGSGGGGQMAAPVTDPLLTQIQVLQSRTVARGVVEGEGLRLVANIPGLPEGWVRDVSIPSPTLQEVIDLSFSRDSVAARSGGAGTGGASVASAKLGEPLHIAGVDLTVAQRPGVDNLMLAVLPIDRAVDGLLGSLRGRAREHTDVIDITYENPSPTKAQAVVNTAAQVFQSMNAQTAKKEQERRRVFIAEQLRKTETLLSEAQAAHNVFRTNQHVYSSQEKFRNTQMDVTGLELRRRELQADRTINQNLLDALSAPHRAGESTAERLSALVSSPGVATNTVVAQLYLQLTKLQSAHDSIAVGPWSAAKDNPDVKRLDALIASTQANIASAVRGQISGIDARITALDELQRRSAGQMGTLPTTEAKESGLLDQVETFHKEAERLRAELQNAQIEEAAEGGQIDIMDLATLPIIPIGSGRLPRVIFALLIGVAFGTLIAYVLENYTSVVRRREEVERITMVPTLAIVPPLIAIAARGNRLLKWIHPVVKVGAKSKVTAGRARNGNGNGNGNGHGNGNGGGYGNGGTPPERYSNDLVTMVDARSQGAESFRTLRTNLIFSSAVQSTREIIVTSSAPSEGKSTTSANLAVAFAQQGQRVLLVDCDLRRPQVHLVFGLPQIPGLTSALIGGTDPAELVHGTNVENLSVLTAGPTPPNPAELLGGVRMRELLDSLAQSYELIILDTPPVLVASDAAILSRHAAGTLLVVRAGKTHAAALRDAIQQLANVGTRVIGTVLNDPDGEVARFASHYGNYFKEYQNAASARP